MLDPPTGEPLGSPGADDIAEGVAKEVHKMFDQLPTSSNTSADETATESPNRNGELSLKMQGDPGETPPSSSSSSPGAASWSSTPRPLVSREVRFVVSVNTSGPAENIERLLQEKLELMFSEFKLAKLSTPYSP